MVIRFLVDTGRLLIGLIIIVSSTILVTLCLLWMLHIKRGDSEKGREPNQEKSQKKGNTSNGGRQVTALTHAQVHHGFVWSEKTKFKVLQANWYGNPQNFSGLSSDLSNQKFQRSPYSNQYIYAKRQETRQLNFV